jgi:hypothetical protein
VAGKYSRIEKPDRVAAGKRRIDENFSGGSTAAIPFRTGTCHAGGTRPAGDRAAGGQLESKAAEQLKWSRMKLYRKMMKYSVNAAGHRVA